jgi:hypothetical protein
MGNKNSGGRGRFVKGQSGNPKGRPKGSHSPSDFLRRKLAEGGTLEQVIAKVVVLALKGERWAIELIFDRMDGKPIQVIDIEQRIIDAAEREGVDPKAAVEAAQRIMEESRY